jgi:predicted acyl esterase
LDHPYLSSQLRFTSSPLETDLEVTGIPTVEFWVNATVPLADLFVSLQCVQENGISCYVTEGNLRLQHRHYHNGESGAEHPIYQPSLDYLPMRTFSQIDSSKDLSKFQLAWMDLLPVSFLFKKGQRIRIAVYGADIKHFTPTATEPYNLCLRAIDEPLPETGFVMKPSDDDTNNSLLVVPREVYCSQLHLPIL